MVIFELDVDESLSILQQNHEYVNMIKDSLSEKRNKYRKFADIINLDFDALDKCCSNYEYTLLIDMYTFSEQLVKNFFYQMIEFESHANKPLNSFIKSKVSRKKFSPNVTYGEVEKTVRDQLLDGFKFILPKDKVEVSMYNEMIQSRHRYAHRGQYSFSIDNFNEIFGIQKYLYSELKMIINYGCDDRLQFQSAYVEIKDIVRKSKIDSSNVNNKAAVLRDIKNKCTRFHSIHGSKLYEIEIMRTVAKNIELVSKMDLRSKTASLNTLNQLKNSY